MNINDIWFRASEEISFLTRETFFDTPYESGIYAWYYPLNIRSYSYKDFSREILSALNYGYGILYSQIAWKGNP